MTDRQNEMNGAQSLVKTLIAGGVETCFANPGTSEMHFVAALDRVPGMRCVLGLFEGVPLPEQHSNHSGFLPDAVFIYKNALEAICVDEEQLRHEVKVTVLHEVGHYFGLDEHELHALGWG